LRILRIEGEPLVDSIRQTFASWDEGSGGTTASEEDIRAALDGFREFIVARTRYMSSKNDRQRFVQPSPLFQSKLGEKLYWPEVTAATIEANVAIANKFSELIAGEGAQIREAPAAIATYKHPQRYLSHWLRSGALNELQIANWTTNPQQPHQLRQLNAA